LTAKVGPFLEIEVPGRSGKCGFALRRWQYSSGLMGYLKQLPSVVMTTGKTDMALWQRG
jgi:hypothetical protein